MSVVFDEHLTSPARLTIVACLVPGEALTFTELKRRTGLADGNLHVQTNKLACAGYIEISKRVRGMRSITRFRITELGLESLRFHTRKLQSILAGEAGQIVPRSRSARDDASQVWS